VAKYTDTCTGGARCVYRGNAGAKGGPSEPDEAGLHGMPGFLQGFVRYSYREG